MIMQMNGLRVNFWFVKCTRVLAETRTLPAAPNTKEWGKKSMCASSVGNGPNQLANRGAQKREK